MQRLGALLLTVVGVVAAVPATADTVRVFAAASLATVLTELGDQWRQSTGTPVSVSAAGSGVLARQILAGAPADIYVSADPAWLDVLLEEGLLRGEGRIDLLSNALVLVGGAAVDDALSPTRVLNGRDVRDAINAATSHDPLARIAVGLLDAVPAGRYALEALTTLGLRAEIDARLVQTDNVRAALRLVAREEAALGIVYATDAMSSADVHTLGVFPQDAHSPIVYAMSALVDSEDTLAFVAWLQGAQAQEAFVRHGFQTLESSD